jgi:hypothetical protein
MYVKRGPSKHQQMKALLLVFSVAYLAILRPAKDRTSSRLVLVVSLRRFQFFFEYIRLFGHVRNGYPTSAHKSTSDRSAIAALLGVNRA